MKKLILSVLFGLSLASVGGLSAFADHHCTCEKDCTEKCEKGDHKDCKCETCDCGKGEGCKHGKCSTKKKTKAAKGAAAPTVQKVSGESHEGHEAH